MCQHQATLAERSRTRYISQCEHGTVHVFWDGVGFHLPETAFVRIANNILQTRTAVQATQSPTDQAHCRLQVNRLSILLPVGEFLPLAGMIDEALGRVNANDDIHRVVETETAQTLRLSSPQALSLPINLN